MNDTLTQYAPTETWKDDTRDAGYDLYAAIGVAQRLLRRVGGFDEQQEKTLRGVLEHLSAAKDFARAFIAQRRSMPRPQ